MAVMRFRLLGRLELETANGAVVPPGAVSRAIVGRLLLAHGAVVQRDTLVEELWEDRGTKNPVGALQVQMAKLRTAFAARGEEARLLFGHGGYRIVLGPEDEVDVPAFETAVREGRDHLAAAEYEKAESELRLGLSMWRGRALDGLEGRGFDTERTRLEDLRLGALEDAATAGLELGRAKELIPELQALLTLAPLRERARARLMLALYRCGRFAEALEVYDTGRRLLKTELGAAPSQELRSLHAAILRHDPSLQGHDLSLRAHDRSSRGTTWLYEGTVRPAKDTTCPGKRTVRLSRGTARLSKVLPVRPVGLRVRSPARLRRIRRSGRHPAKAI
jgi:DNA-binding SARP family transcriptional activator